MLRTARVSAPRGLRAAVDGRTPGQVLVMFVLFLAVLLGAAALAIDYANWLLTDRRLQNVSDHAALAGASVFSQDDQRTSNPCNPGTKCGDARLQAWHSISQDLGLGLNDTVLACLAANNTPIGGWTNASQAPGCTAAPFGHHVWVSTPPPLNASYTGVGGRYASNQGIVFARVDESTRSFLAGIFGIGVRDRTGWATAGSLPTDFALETFCRNNVAPQSGVCVNSAGLSIDGQGGIRLLRGDIGTNESLKVTSNTGSGVVVQAGNVFVVNGTCASSTWNCPQTPATTGGIADKDPVAFPSTANNENVFYAAPLPVPHFASPVDQASIKAWDCAGATATNWCIPYKNQTGTGATEPGDWICQTTGSTNRCGSPTVTTVGGVSTVTCVGQGGGSPPLHYYPTGIATGASGINADSGHPQTNGNKYKNIDDDYDAGDPDTAATPANPPTDFLYYDNLNITGSGTKTQTSSFTVNLGQSGPRLAGTSTVRFVAFKTNNGVLSNDGYDVTVQASLRGGVTTPVVDTPRTLTGTPTQYSFTASSSQITDYNALQLQLTFSETGVNNDASERAGGIAWAEIQHPDPQPALTPMIPPGYYRSIEVPANSCAILDPTAEYSSLQPYQMPGIYRFGGNGSNNQKKIKLNNGSYLIGDGVTLVFDADWPASGSNQGIALDSTSALILNTMKVPGAPPCTPSEPETTTVNQSAPLGALPYSGVCAAWGVDTTSSPGIRAGVNAWPVCDPANVSNPHCVNRSEYNPVASYHGVTFYLTPTAWPPSSIGSSRFDMSGGASNTPGIAFRGVLYAPYDDVKISGSNGFSTVGQVLAWTAKFNGGSAYIDLDYPYDLTPSQPYLLEPTLAH
jgi:hypothetical protein